MKPTALGPHGVNYRYISYWNGENVRSRPVFAMGIVKPANDTVEFYKSRALRVAERDYPGPAERALRAYQSLMELVARRHLTNRTERE